MDFLLISIVLVAGAFIINKVYKINRTERNKIKDSKNSLTELLDFKPTRKITDNLGNLIALDTNSKKFLLDNSGNLEIHDFNEITGFKITEHSEDNSGQASTIICKANTEELNEERVEAIDIVSSVNFILNKKINGIDLKIFFKEHTTEGYNVKLFDAFDATDKKDKYISLNNSSQGQVYKNAIEISENWCKDLTEIINKNNYHQPITEITKN